MSELEVSSDTTDFEVPASLDEQGRLTNDCVRRALATMDTHGFVVLTGLLSDEEAAFGLDLIRQTIDDPERNRCTFASETDNRYLRRDFCSLPSNEPVIRFAATFCQRLEGIYSEYCGRTRALLEIITLTSYRGSSHQYIHRDPMGVISLLAAVEDVSEEQGGTVFVPGTHGYGGAEYRHGGAADEMMRLFRIQCNWRILVHNLKKLWQMRKGEEAPLGDGEFLDRMFSTRWDQHQPNLLRFLLGKNNEFSIRMLGPRTLWKLYRQRKTLSSLFRLVQAAPRKGTVILYRSDILHAGPDNRSPVPRRLFAMSIARDVIDTKYWHDGYSPHPTLTADPLCLGDLLGASRLPQPSTVSNRRAKALVN